MTVKEARVMPALLPAQSRETPRQCCASCQRKRDAGVRILRCFPVLETVSDARRSPCRRVITTNYAISAPRRLLNRKALTNHVRPNCSQGRPLPSTRAPLSRHRYQALIDEQHLVGDRASCRIPVSRRYPTLSWEPRCRSDNPHLSTLSRGCNHRAICDRYAGRGHRPGAR